MKRQPSKFAIALAVAAACSSGLLAACGSDDDSGTASTAADTAPTDEAATTDEVATTDAPDATDAAGPADPAAAPADTAAATSEPAGDHHGDDSASLATFCEAYSDITIAMAGQPDPAVLTENIAIVTDTAPTDIASAAGVMTDAVSAVLASQGTDFSPLESPEFTEAQGTVDPYVFENCEFANSVEVTGIDYGFEGLPATMSSGRTAILFTNNGAEAHEIAIMRRNDGVTESFEELLAMPEAEAMQKATPVGGAFAPSSGAQALLVGDFEPGEYIAICFVPVGSSMSADGAMTEGTGEPHFMHGMQQEFTVTG